MKCFGLIVKLFLPTSTTIFVGLKCLWSYQYEVVEFHWKWQQSCSWRFSWIRIKNVQKCEINEVPVEDPKLKNLISIRFKEIQY